MPLDAPDFPAASPDDSFSYHRVFESLPGPYLLLSPGLTVRAASDDFLRATGQERAAIAGKSAREVLTGPGGPYGADAAAPLEASLQRVLATRQAHQMDLLPVTTPDPDGNRYWQPTHLPVLAENGTLTAILHRADDVTAQVVARQHLEAREHRFRTLLESIPAMAWTAGPDGRINYYNSQWYAYTGQSEAEATGTGWTGVTHPDDVATCLPLWQRALATGTRYQAECRYRRAADGAWRWHLTRAVPQTDAAGGVVQWVGTCTDIHEQKLYAQQLSVRETYFRQMTDNLPVAVWVTRPDGACTYLNRTWYDYTGQTEEEALGLGWTSATHPQDISRSREAFLDANTRRTTFKLLYRLRRRDGAYRWFLDWGEPLHDAAGNFEGFTGVVIDVHEQQRAEEQLLLSVQAGRVGIWEWDVVNDRATYSDLLQEMFGFAPGTFKGEFEGAYGIFQSVIYPEDRQLVNEQLQGAFSQMQRAFYVEFRVARPSGEITWIAERGEVAYEGKQPVRMNGTCIDITDRKRAEEAAHRLSEELAAVNEELAASNEELRAANEETQASNEELTETNGQLARVNADLDNFVYTASHDLKAPILNVEGLLKALERQLPGEVREKEIVRQLYE
ncbi:MAG TPA: PAS domain S-box protein, partial [Cytophagales bacterium]